MRPGMRILRVRYSHDSDSDMVELRRFACAGLSRLAAGRGSRGRTGLKAIPGAEGSTGGRDGEEETYDGNVRGNG